MNDSTSGRTIMVRPNFLVPALPESVLANVFGNRQPDSSVVHIVSIFEYYKQGGAVPSLMHDRLLAAMRDKITRSNMDDFLALLVQRGLIDDFVGLIQYPVDLHGELRAYILDNGADLLRISYYASWYGIDPKGFLDGFVLGVSESFALVFASFGDLVKLGWQVAQWWYKTVNVGLVYPVLAAASLAQQALYVMQLAKVLLAELNPAQLPEKAVKRWREWNDEFLNNLLSLKSFEAGRQLGGIAGDLWNALTGIVGLIKLIPALGKLAVKFVPLVFAGMRRAAAIAASAIKLIAELLVSIGRGVIDSIEKVGIATIRTLFPPAIIEAVVAEGRAMVQSGRLSLMMVPAESYAVAYGAPMSQHFAMMVIADGKPVMSAATSDVVPTKRMVRDLRRSLDDQLERLEDLKDVEAEAIATQKDLEGVAKASEIQAVAKALSNAEESLQSKLGKLVNEVARDEFTKQVAGSKKPEPGSLGNAVDTAMGKLAPATLSAAAPGAEYAAKATIRTGIERAVKGTVTKKKWTQMEKVMNETMVSMLGRRQDVLDLLGFGTSKAERSPEAIEAFFKRYRPFNWKPDTTAGSLQSDFLFWDKRAKRMINLDWTSSSKLDKFEANWRRAFLDTGKRFGGDWDALPELYKQLGKEMPDDLIKDLRELTAHALRETIVRKMVLEEILGDLWRVSSREVVYNGLPKQWEEFGKAAKEAMTAAEAAVQSGKATP